MYIYHYTYAYIYILYVCMYVCTYVRTNVRMHVRIYVCTPCKGRRVRAGPYTGIGSVGERLRRGARVLEGADNAVTYVGLFCHICRSLLPHM